MVKEISAEDLEAACRKCTRLTVSDTQALARVLDSMVIKYSIVNDSVADVYDPLNITQLIKALDQEGCQVLSMQERDESLESYFINLVGGAHHE